jgi:hypothetical protein
MRLIGKLHRFRGYEFYLADIFFGNLAIFLRRTPVTQHFSGALYP